MPVYPWNCGEDRLGPDLRTCCFLSCSHITHDASMMQGDSTADWAYGADRSYYFCRAQGLCSTTVFQSGVFLSGFGLRHKITKNIYFFMQRGDLVVVNVEVLYTSQPGKSGGRKGFDLVARKGQVRHSKTIRLCSLKRDVKRDVKSDP